LLVEFEKIDLFGVPGMMGARALIKILFLREA